MRDFLSGLRRRGRGTERSPPDGQAKQLLERALIAARSQENRANEADLLVQMGEVVLADHELERSEISFYAGRPNLRRHATLSHTLIRNVRPRQCGTATRRYTKCRADALKAGLRG